MSTDSLKRVIWRLQELRVIPDGIYTLSEIELAIMKECGTDPRTIKNNIANLIKLKWIKRINRYNFKIVMEE